MSFSDVSEMLLGVVDMVSSVKSTVQRLVELQEQENPSVIPGSSGASSWLFPVVPVVGTSTRVEAVYP